MDDDLDLNFINLKFIIDYYNLKEEIVCVRESKFPGWRPVYVGLAHKSEWFNNIPSCLRWL